MLNFKTMTIMFAVLILLSAACSDSPAADLDSSSSSSPQNVRSSTTVEEGEVAIEVDDVEPEKTISFGVESQDGDGSFEMGSAQPPEDFPLPIVEGGHVALSMSSGEGAGYSASIAVLYPVERFDEIHDFYEKWLKDNGYDPAKTIMEEPTRMVLFLAPDAPEGFPGVMLTITEQDDGELGVSIVVEN